MSGIAVVTDTTQYLPRDVVDRHGLSLVSLYVNWDGRTRSRERHAHLRRLLRAPAHERGELPSTSQPSVGDFLAVYEPLIERGDDVVSIHLSGGISGTVRPPSRRATRWSSAGSTRRGSWCSTPARAAPGTG